MKSMGVLPINVDNVHASFNILPKDSYIDFLAPGRKSAFSPYSAKQAAGTTVPKDSPKKTKSRCCPIADEEDDDDYEAYMLRMEREADQKESLANKQVIEPESSMMPRSSKRVSWSSDEDIKDYDHQLVAKQVIDTKTKMKTSTTFKGTHYSSSSELAKQVIEPKPKMSKTSSKRRSHSLTEDDIEPKTKKLKLISNGSHYPTMDDEVAKPKPKTKNKATSSKRSRSPVNDDDDEDYELAKKTAEPKTKKNKASSSSSSSSKRSHSSTTEDECDGENDKEMMKLKRKKQKEIVKELDSKPPITNEVTKRLKEFITSDAINGKDLTLVIQKLLFISDLSRGHNRLAMPINQLKTLEFLTPEEKELLDNKSDFDVQLVGPELEIYKKPMNLVKWNMQTTQNYVLKTHWSEFVADHVEDLVENSIIQVWSFRKDNKLCFALAIVGRAMFFDNQDDSPSSS